MSGYFAGTVDFGGESPVSTSSEDDLDMMVLRLGPDGTLDWVATFGGPGADGGADSDGGNEIAVADDGTVLVLAGSDGRFVLSEREHYDSLGFSDAYLLSLAGETGELRWVGRTAVRAEDAGTARAKCLTSDAAGNVYMGGDYVGLVDVVGGDGLRSLPTPSPATDRQAFLTRWTSSGELVWVHAWGESGADLCKAVVADSSGDLFVVGQMTTGADFLGETRSARGGGDLFVWHLDPEAMNTLWVTTASAELQLLGAEAVLSADEGVIFGFSLRGTTQLAQVGADPLVVAPPDEGAYPLVLEYRADGSIAWTLMGDESAAANVDELRRSGDRLYVDVPIQAGSYRFGTETRSSNGTKDALLVAIDL